MAKDGGIPIFMRSSALRHFRDVVEKAAAPDLQMLFEEFITQQDFKAWLLQTSTRLPSFWFESREQLVC